jgi:hypothetical protein
MGDLSRCETQFLIEYSNPSPQDTTVLLHLDCLDLLARLIHGPISFISITFGASGFKSWQIVNSLFELVFRIFLGIFAGIHKIKHQFVSGFVMF